MKHTFLLDFNILYHAIRCVDAYDQPNTAAADLIEAIGRNCHRIILNKWLINEYQRRLSVLAGQRWLHDSAVRFITQFLRNSQKQEFLVADPSALPEGCAIPVEDIEITRYALAAGAIFITADSELQQAIENQLGERLRALSPLQAMALAADR